jgi:hypothetical protein
MAWAHDFITDNSVETTAQVGAVRRECMDTAVIRSMNDD